MKTAGWLIIPMVIACVCGAAAQAQPPADPEVGACILQHKLSLNEDQTDRIIEILYTAGEACGQPGASGFKDCMRAQKDQIGSQIEALLSSAQVEAFRKLEDGRRRQGRHMKP